MRSRRLERRAHRRRAPAPSYVDAQLVEAFELVDRRWVLLGSHDESSVARIAPFAEIEIVVRRLFLPRGT